MTPSDQGGGRDLWPPPPAAFQVQRWDADDPTRPTSILVQHPTTPFRRDVAGGTDRALQEVAHRYLVEVEREVAPGLPPWWLEALDPGNVPHPDFGWLRSVPPEAGRRRPIGSDAVRHDPGKDDPRKGRPSISFNLLAAERVGGFVLGSEFGVRVVLHARPIDGGGFRIRVNGLSASLPFGEYASDGDSERFWMRGGGTGFVDGFLERSRTPLAAKLGLDPASVFFRGIRLGRSGAASRRIELRGRGLSAPRTSRSEPYEFIASTTVGADGRLPDAVFATKVPLTACMSGTARVFRCDPASQGGPRDYRKRRPTRSEEALDAFRVPEVEPVPLGHPAPPNPPDLVTVVQSWFVLGDNPNAVPPTKGVPLPPPPPAPPPPPPPIPPVRSNDFSAVSTLRNLREIFLRFTLYGIPTGDYFNLAALPLKGFYRSGVRPGPGKDGETVNARVLPEGWAVDAITPPTANDRPVLQIHLALGDLSTRARKPWNRQNRSPAEPLGIAADANFLWHEVGHALMVATLGELEFRFAHSTGDALAAITADPFSRLGDDAEFWRWRFHTFPWVYVARSHGRCVLHGWGWHGSLGRAVRRIPDDDRLRRKGYWTEQILSTSLFRLYRCLGGDTVLDGWPEPNRVARKRASDYAVYLIMTALQMLGDQRIAPATRADAFAAALVRADTHAEVCPTDDGAGGEGRVGGCAHKAIRWAFEAQGMYPADPDRISEAPGLPPAVDIYIRDRRPVDEAMPEATVQHGPGTYVPVSLDWAGRPPSPPLWFAAADAIGQADGGLVVRVANRGAAVAQNVTVTLRWRRWPDGQSAPPWDAADPNWGSTAASPPQNVAPGPAAEVVFGPFPLPALPAGRYIVLAQADCAEDLSNIEPGTGLACTENPTPLDELVPFDNNLGLRLVQLA